MLISNAYAQAIDSAAAVGAAAPPDSWSVFMWNMGLVLVLLALFYVLMIMPQQKRLKEHRAMLDALKKGDKVITAGGLIGKVDKIVDEAEVIIDLGHTKVTALRSTIQAKNNEPANDDGGDAKSKKSK